MDGPIPSRAGAPRAARFAVMQRRPAPSLRLDAPQALLAVPDSTGRVQSRTENAVFAGRSRRGSRAIACCALY